MLPNPHRRDAGRAVLGAAASVVLAGALLGGVGVSAGFGPFFLGIVAASGALVALLVAVVLHRQAARFDALVAGTDLLARWTYEPAEWAEFLALEDGRRRAESYARAAGLGFVAVLFVVLGLAGIAWAPADAELGAGVVLFGVLFGIAAFVARRADGVRARDRAPSEAIIGRDAAIFRNRHQPWRAFGVRPLEARFRPEERLLVVRYAISASDQTAEHELRIPVPRGREAEAERAAAAIVGR